MTAKKAPVELCRVPDCENERKTRGLCSGHYSRVAKLVSVKKTTWDSLEERGIVLKVQRGQMEDFFVNGSIEL